MCWSGGAEHHYALLRSGCPPCPLPQIEKWKTGRMEGRKGGREGGEGTWMVEQPFVPFGRDGAIAQGQDRGTRAGSDAGSSCWSGEPDVGGGIGGIGVTESMVRGSEVERRRKGGWNGEREGSKEKEGHAPTFPIRHPWCSSHAAGQVRLLPQCLSSLSATEDGDEVGWRQGGRSGRGARRGCCGGRQGKWRYPRAGGGLEVKTPT